MQTLLKYTEILREYENLPSSLELPTLLLLSNVEVSVFKKILTFMFYQAGIPVNIETNEYGTFDQSLYDVNFDKYQDIIILSGTQVFQNNFYMTTEGHEEALNKLMPILENFTANGKRVLINTLPHSQDRILGNSSSQAKSSINYQISMYNKNLLAFSQKTKGVLCYDLNHEAQLVGLNNWYHNELWIHAKYHSHPKYFPQQAKCISTLYSSLSGKQVKCVVLDLDNTIWGGVVGDDGLDGIILSPSDEGEIYHNFQKYLRELKKNGYLLAICSKNYEDIALEVFKNHPDMILRLDDIVAHKINWESKAQNLFELSKELNISLDSFVFLDDNPFERNLIRTQLPEVTVPELPKNPADYIEYLNNNYIFEKTHLTNEDLIRTKMYKDESKRKSERSKVDTIEDYLKSLNMVATIKEISSAELERASQLLERSNQFNLRTQRTSLAQLENMISKSDYYNFIVYLSDKFGNMGGIAVVILKIQDQEVFIEEMVMSCRVLKRGVEDIIFQKILSIAEDKDIVGEYIKTKKNSLVEDLFKNFGFSKEDQTSKWRTHKSKIRLNKHFINTEGNDDN